MHLYGKTYLIIVDSFSKFINVKLMGKTDVKSISNELMRLLKYFGLPKETVSDNGPPFSSSEYEEL